MKKKVVIIGAGPAGITAGYELLRCKPDDYEVTIYEETASIGGISKTVTYNGNRMDIGGHRFFSKDERVMRWWSNIMPTQGKPSFDDKKLERDKILAIGGPNPEREDKVMLVRDRVSRIYYDHKFFDYPITMKKQTFKNMGFKTTMKAGLSYVKSSCSKLEESSLENFYVNRFGSVLYSMFFEKYTEKLWGRHPREISADWGSQRVKGLSVSAVIKDMFSKKNKNNNKNVETSLIESFYYPKYGPGQLWETALDQFVEMGGKVFINCKVIAVNHDRNGKVCSINVDNNGTVSSVQGDIFISSMPLKDLIASMNDVPDRVYQIANSLPYRDFVTVGLLLDKLNLVNETKIKTLNNIVPDCWIYVQDGGVKLGRIQIFNNWSPYMVKDVENTVWIGLEYFCDENDEFWNMSEEECVEMAVDELIKMEVISDKSNVLDSHREKVKKAYPAYFDTYSEIDKVIQYLDNFENLYCVGRNGQHRYNNMDHSMATSFETVRNIMADIPSKDNIWRVNTEKDYHEIRKK